LGGRKKGGRRVNEGCQKGTRGGGFLRSTSLTTHIACTTITLPQGGPWGGYGCIPSCLVSPYLAELVAADREALQGGEIAQAQDLAPVLNLVIREVEDTEIDEAVHTALHHTTDGASFVTGVAESNVTLPLLPVAVRVRGDVEDLDPVAAEVELLEGGQARLQGLHLPPVRHRTVQDERL